MTPGWRRLAPPAILLTGLAAYAAWLVHFLADPATSWVHVESSGANRTLLEIMTYRWSTTLSEIVRGIGIDPHPGRFRPVSHAVEYLDAFMRYRIVAVVGFVPALANLSSLVYFAVAPVLALLVARRLIGPTSLGALLIALAVGAFLTSTGYLSASIFVFRPAKKLAILLTLLQLLVVTYYVDAPRRWHLFAFGGLQFIGALTDEVALVIGIALPVLAVSCAVALRRAPASHYLWLAPFWLATAAAFWIGRLLRPDHAPYPSPNVLDALSWLTRPFSDYNVRGTRGETFAGLVGDHLAGAFSALYGVAWTKFIFLAAFLAAIGIAATVLLRAAGRAATETSLAAQLAIGLAMLAGMAIFSVLLIQYWGMPYQSKYNYYYASILPVFALFVTCAALGLARLWSVRSGVAQHGAAAVQVAIAAALVLVIAANLRYLPILNRIEAITHNNPYPIEAINRAAGSRHGPASIPRCSQAEIEAQLDREIASLGSNRARYAQHFDTWPPRLGGGETFIADILAMMLRTPPAFAIIEGCSAAMRPPGRS